MAKKHGHIYEPLRGGQIYEEMTVGAFVRRYNPDRYVLIFYICYTTLCTDCERPDLFIVLSVPSVATPLLLRFLISTTKVDILNAHDNCENERR